MKFISRTLVSSDAISCTLTSNAVCVATASVNSNSININVTPSVPASIAITASETSICPATSVTFTATATNGGLSPFYQWKKNNLNVGANSNTYTDTTLNNNDVIVCEMTSNATCLSVAMVSSNVVTMTVNPILVPAITISAADTSLCAGDALGSLTAITVNGGKVRLP